MAAGRLSYSQLRAISRIAQPGEHGLVEDLIGVARHGTVAQLEVVVRGLRTVDHNEKATDPGEYLKQSWSSDSRWQLSARLDPERGALVGAAIGAIAGRDGCSQAEALARLAEIGLASLADADNPARELRGDERAAVVIHLDAARVPRHPRSAERGAADPSDQRSVERDPADSSDPRSADGPAMRHASRATGWCRVQLNAARAPRTLPGRMRGSRVGRVFLIGWCSGCCVRVGSAPSSRTA